MRIRVDYIIILTEVLQMQTRILPVCRYILVKLIMQMQLTTSIEGGLAIKPYDSDQMIIYNHGAIRGYSPLTIL